MSRAPVDLDTKAIAPVPIAPCKIISSHIRYIDAPIISRIASIDFPDSIRPAIIISANPTPAPIRFCRKGHIANATTCLGNDNPASFPPQLPGPQLALHNITIHRARTILFFLKMESTTNFVHKKPNDQKLKIQTSQT